MGALFRMLVKLIEKRKTIVTNTDKFNSDAIVLATLINIILTMVAITVYEYLNDYVFQRRMITVILVILIATIYITYKSIRYLHNKYLPKS